MAKEIEVGLREGKNMGKEIDLFHKQFATKKEIVKNLVPATGLEVLANAIVETPPVDAITGAPVAYDLNPRVTHGAVGIGLTAPANGDTTLENEIYRQTISSQSKNGNVGYNTFFLGLNEANGNDISEFGLFCGDDGNRLFSRILVVPVFAKTVDKTLTVDVSHTFISA